MKIKPFLLLSFDCFLNLKDYKILNNCFLVGIRIEKIFNTFKFGNKFVANLIGFQDCQPQTITTYFSTDKALFWHYLGTTFLFFNWNSLHARMKCHYERRSHKKKKKSRKESSLKDSICKRCGLILYLKPFRA